MKKNPTIKDIARRAKVSPTAVSMALNKSPRIGEVTKKKILRIAKELNYQPNYVARSLVSKKSHTLGLIITSIIAATALKGVELTTVSQKKYEMGALAVKILIERIGKGAPPMSNQVILEPELVIRTSCGYRFHGYQSE